MNNSNAAAKRRRAGIQATIPPTPPPVSAGGPQNGASMNSTPAGGLTLQQVISLIDTRLIVLEKFMKDSQENELTIPPMSEGMDGMDSGSVFMDSKEFTDFVGEINQRFQLFADEINSLKEVVLKLQGFTMDVNKMLLSHVSKTTDSIPNIELKIEETSSDEPEESPIVSSEDIPVVASEKTKAKKTK